jgi:two-component system phosphate regulon sensor histidine kinase PhoR
MTILLWIIACLGTACAIGSAIAAAQIQKLRRKDDAAHATTLDCVNADLAGAANQLKQTNAEYEALLSGCGSGVFVLDPSDMIERANPEACRLLGIYQQQLEGRSLLQATLSSELQASVRLAREQNSVQRCEIRAPGVTGSCLSVTIVPAGTDTTATSRCLVIANDVTELRRLEMVRRDFVANVSHELRTPLTSIRAMAETLQDGAMRDLEVADHFLGTISAEVQRLTRISEDLLILSHAESRPADSSRVALSTLLNDVVNRFQKQAENEGIGLHLDAPAALYVKGSRDQIEQVIINLIDNAIKYTQKGGNVTVTAKRHGQVAAIYVADTGIGIMNQDLPRIFERFYRVDKARSRESGGTGLGLSIVKHIVESHGGNVTVESEFNRGSTFTFTLPCI